MSLHFFRTACAIYAVVFLCSCENNSVFEAKKDFEENYWPKTEPVVFDFKVKDVSSAYDLSYFIRSSLEYPYQNIYLQYYLEDSLGNILSKRLNNVELFDSKTGKPVGNGLGDIYDLEKTFLVDFEFPRPGTYRLRIDQYMRKDTLRHIHSVGLILKQDQKK